MASICSLTKTISGTYFDRTGGYQNIPYQATGTIYVDYSITQNLADKVVITTKVVASVSMKRTDTGASFGRARFSISSAGNTWNVNGVGYNMTQSSDVDTSFTSTADFSATQTTTVSKTHSAQNIAVNAGYNPTLYIISPEHRTVTDSTIVSGTIPISAKTSYTVSYNANGGSGAPSAQTKWYGETLTLSSTKPTRTGYTFQGWAKTATGAVAYGAGGSFGINANTTLYAVWKINTYSVTYNARGGSPTPSAQTKTYGTNLKLTTAVPKLSGYTFKGWATSTANANAGTVNYASGATYTGNVALTLYAVWELTYSKPKITSISVARCTQDGTLDDNGDYAKVTFSWSVFRSSSARYYGGSTTPYSANGVSNCTVTIATTPAKSTTVSLSGASGTNSYAILGGVGSFEDDQSYKATVSITDSQTIYSDHTVSASATLPPLFYPMDYNADASALGFFMPAPDSGDGIYSGKDIHFFVDEHASTGWDALITEPLTINGWTDALE